MDLHGSKDIIYKIECMCMCVRLCGEREREREERTYVWYLYWHVITAVSFCDQDKKIGSTSFQYSRYLLFRLTCTLLSLNSQWGNIFE